jgi:seryl-tRNA synthetase
MLQINYIKENKEEIIQRLDKRNLQITEVLDLLLEVDSKRRKIQAEMDGLLAEANNIAKQVGELFKQGKQEDANVLKLKSQSIKDTVKGFEDELKELENKQLQILYTIPNAPHISVPKGKSAEDNEIVYRDESRLPHLNDSALPHWEITSKYDLIDFELGVKITGAGFPVYKNKGAKLQRALINFFLDYNTAAGYMEVQPPHLVNEASGYGTGQLPDKEGQMYFVNEDGFYLIPTAEVPVTNLYRDVILKESDFPIKNTAYTPCFRREAGSYGKDVRGLNRLHQFDKVEIVQIAKPEDSYIILEEMVNHVKSILEQLELPFRILKLCGGDMGFSSALTYDFEVYSAAQKRWLEVSSTSNFEAFQSNRLKLRYKDATGKTKLAHTLNGSAMALPRIVAALLENNQTPEGIKIPKALVPYTGFDIIQ